MVRKVFHIEDSEVSRRYLKDLLEGIAPALELVPFPSADQATRALEALPDSDLPELILADHGLPRMDGTEFVCWMKSHPRLRSIPLVLVSAEADEQRKRKMKSLGVLQCLDKPLQPEQLSLVLNHPRSPAPERDRAGEAHFVEEALNRVEACEAWIRNPQTSGAPGAEWMRQLHTLKGNAFTYRQPVLGEFLHELERFSARAAQIHPGYDEEARRIFLEAIELVRELLFAVREDRPANLQRLDLTRSMARYGRTSSEADASKTPVPDAGVPASAPSSTGSGARFSGTGAEPLPGILQEIQQAKNRLGVVARNLQREFPEDHFPTELARIHEQLSRAAGRLGRHVFALRTVPVENIRDIAVRIVMETSERVQREVDLDLEMAQGETIDCEVLRRLETALLHLVRNSMDHGFAGRSAGNRILVSLVACEGEAFELRVEDNGRGIDLDALRVRVLQTGMVSEAVWEAMSPEQARELVFADGISTCAEATEISGRGLGLAAVKAEVEAIGGSVSIERPASGGTAFVVRVPRLMPW